MADLPGVFNADSGQRIDLEDIEMCLVRVNATKGCSDPMQDVSFFRDVDVTTKFSMWRHDVSHMISSNFEVGRASALLTHAGVYKVLSALIVLPHNTKKYTCNTNAESKQLQDKWHSSQDRKVRVYCKLSNKASCEAVRQAFGKWKLLRGWCEPPYPLATPDAQSKKRRRAQESD